MGIIRLIKFAISVMLLVHLVSCLWYYLAKVQDFNPETWVLRYGYIDRSNFDKYLASTYFILTTLTTVGFGDIVAYSSPEKIFEICWMLLGVGFYSFAIGNLSTIMSTMDSRQNHLRARLTTLNEFAKETKLPDYLRIKIKQFIEHNHRENIYSWFDQDQLLKELPAALRIEVTIHMNQKIVDKITFFQGKDPNFVASILPILKSLRLKSGEIVYKEGDFAEEVFFLIEGRVNLKASNGVIFKTYVQGSYFGEVEIFENELRDCTVQVAPNYDCELLLLSKKDLERILLEFSHVNKELRTTATIRRQRNKKAKEHAEQLQIQDIIKENSSKKQGIQLQQTVDQFKETIRKEKRAQELKIQDQIRRASITSQSALPIQLRNLLENNDTIDTKAKKQNFPDTQPSKAQEIIKPISQEVLENKQEQRAYVTANKVGWAIFADNSQKNKKTSQNSLSLSLITKQPQRPSLRLQNQIINQVKEELNIKDSDTQKIKEVFKKSFLGRKTKKVEQNIMDQAKRRQSLNLDLKEQHETILQKMRRKSSFKRANSHISEQDGESSSSSPLKSSSSDSSQSKSGSKSESSSQSKKSSKSNEQKSFSQDKSSKGSSIKSQSIPKQSAKKSIQTQRSQKLSVNEISGQELENERSKNSSQVQIQSQRHRANSQQSRKNSNQKKQVPESIQITTENQATLETEPQKESKSHRKKTQRSLTIETELEPIFSDNYIQIRSPDKYVSQEEESQTVFSSNYIQSLSPKKKNNNDDTKITFSNARTSLSNYPVDSESLKQNYPIFNQKSLQEDQITQQDKQEISKHFDISEELKQEFSKEFSEAESFPQQISKAVSINELNDLERQRRKGITGIQANEINVNLQRLSNQGIQLEQIMNEKRKMEEEIQQNMEIMEKQIDTIQQRQEDLIAQLQTLLGTVVNKM